jgi:hypothetical protein
MDMIIPKVRLYYWLQFNQSMLLLLFVVIKRTKFSSIYFNSWLTFLIFWYVLSVIDFNI